MIISSGVMWSQEVKHGIIKHIPQVALLDFVRVVGGGGFRAVGHEQGRRSRDGEVHAGHRRGRVHGRSQTAVSPAPSEPGFIARGGNIPVGYWKDPAKSAKTFPTIGGRRWSIPGDYCLAA